MSSTTFGVIYEMRLEGADAARENFENVMDAFQRGDATIQDVDKSLRSMDRANAQVASSLNRAQNAFRVAHPNFSLFERSLGRIASVSRTLIGLFDSFNILQLRLTGTTLERSKAEEDVAKALRAVQELEAAGITSGTVYEQKVNELTEARSKLKDVTMEETAATQQAVVQTGLLTLVAIGQIPAMISLAGSISGAVGAAGLLAGGIAALAAGLVIAGVNIVANKDDTETWRKAVEDARASVQNLPPVLREVADVFTIVSGGLILMASDFSEWASSGIASVTDWSTVTQDQIDEWSQHNMGTIALWSDVNKTTTDDIAEAWRESMRIMALVADEGTEEVNNSFLGMSDFVLLTLDQMASAMQSAWASAMSQMAQLGNVNIPGITVTGITTTLTPPGLGGRKGRPGGGPEPMQFGGLVTRPTLALLGEAGPELVTPLNRAGAAGVNISVYIQGFVGSKEELVRIVSEGIHSESLRLFR